MPTVFVGGLLRLPVVVAMLLLLLLLGLGGSCHGTTSASGAVRRRQHQQQQPQHKTFQQHPRRSLPQQENEYAPQQQQAANYSIGGDRYASDHQHGVRVLIYKFDVLLSFNSNPLTESDLSVLHEILEQVIGTYIQSQLSTSTGQPTPVDYVLLGAIASAQATASTTRILLGKGIVNFNATASAPTSSSEATSAERTAASSRNGVPTRHQVNAWVQQAIDTTLLVALQQQSTIPPYEALTQVSYVPLVDFSTDDSAGNNNNNNDTDNDDPAFGGISDGPTKGSSSTRAFPIAAVVGAVVGAVLIVGAVLFVRRNSRRRSRQKRTGDYVEQHNAGYSVKEMIDDHPDDHDDPTSDNDVDDPDIYYDHDDQPNKDRSTGTGGSGSNSKRLAKVAEEDVGDDGDDPLNTTKDTIASNVSAPSPSPQHNKRKSGGGDNNHHSQRSINNLSLSLLSYTGSSPHRGGPPSDATSVADARSLAGESESDFTVNTEAGDSLALQSLSHAFGGGGGTRSNAPTPPPPPRTTESFERSRPPPSLQKDMLVSAWAGRAPRLGGIGGGTSPGSGGDTHPLTSSSLLLRSPHTSTPQAPQTDSVLLPSHFSASAERRQQQQLQDQQQRLYRHPQPETVDSTPSPHRPGGGGANDSSLDTTNTSWSNSRGSGTGGAANTTNDVSQLSNQSSQYPKNVSTHHDDEDFEDDDDTEASTSAPPFSMVFQQAFGTGHQVHPSSQLTVDVPPPQTPPSQTAGNRFFKPRPSPGNIV